MDARAVQPAPCAMSKPDAVRFLARQAGLGEIDPTRADIAGVLARLPLLRNLDVALRPAATVADVVRRLVMPDLHRPVPLPRFTNGRPDSFPERSGFEDSPAFEVLEVPDGLLAQISRAPVVLERSASTVLADFSSPYAGLVHGFDFELRAVLTAARHIAGTAIVLCDDIHPLNYSHWLLDELPRLACLGERRDVTVIASEEDRPFKRETLRLCGFSDSRVVHLADFRAVRADRLLVPRDIHAMPHPAFKAAPWVLNFLRARIGFPALLQGPSGPAPGKLFVSRDDSLGRRIINEPDLLQVLQPLGYERVTLAGLSVARQVALFATATHVLGAHGAGLANFAFARPGARLLELFPQSYGTPTYYVIAAGQGNAYATYISRDVVAGERTQIDDFRLDMAGFRRCCDGLL